MQDNKSQPRNLDHSVKGQPKIAIARVLNIFHSNLYSLQFNVQHRVNSAVLSAPYTYNMFHSNACPTTIS